MGCGVLKAGHEILSSLSGRKVCVTGINFVEFIIKTIEFSVNSGFGPVSEETCKMFHTNYSLNLALLDLLLSATISKLFVKMTTTKKTKKTNKTTTTTNKLNLTMDTVSSMVGSPLQK